MTQLQEDCPADSYCLMVYRNFDDGKKMVISKVPINAPNMEGFVRSFRYPSISELTPDTYKEFFSKDSEFMILLCKELDCDESKDIFTRFAIQNRNRMKFIFGFVDTPIGGHLMRFLDIKKDTDLPAVRVVKIQGREVLKYKPSTNEKILGTLTDNKILTKKPKQEDSKFNKFKKNRGDREEQMQKKLRNIRKQGGYGRTFV